MSSFMGTVFKQNQWAASDFNRFCSDTSEAVACPATIHGMLIKIHSVQSLGHVL
jgi:hypothetical protein